MGKKRKSSNKKADMLKQLEIIMQRDRFEPFVLAKHFCLFDKVPQVKVKYLSKRTFLPKDQYDLDRWHAGSIQHASYICAEANGYNSSTKNMSRLIELWNNYVAFIRSLPDTIYYPDTPENRRKVQEARAAMQRCKDCFSSGADQVLNNLERDVAAFEVATSSLCQARDNFERSPGESSRLRHIREASAQAEERLDALRPYYVVNNDRSRRLFARAKSSLNRAQQCASIDEIDLIRDEYIQYRAHTVPVRGSFVRIGSPWNSGDYNHAIVSSTMRTAAEAIINQTSTTISSAYRNPAKQNRINPDSPNSRHVYGDAVDILTNRDRRLWCRVAEAACAQGASWVEPASMIPNFDHVHADWRGVNVGSSYCNDRSVCQGIIAPKEPLLQKEDITTEC